MDLHQYAVEEAIRAVALADSLDEDDSGGHVVMTEADLRGLLQAAGLAESAIDEAVRHAFHEHGAAKVVALADTWGSSVRCPRCGGRPRPILYGMPGREVIELVHAGLIAIGGCIVDEDNPTVECRDCGEGWQG
jgi:hypothetical protein